MSSTELRPETQLERSPYLVVKPFSATEIRIYSRLHGNLTTYPRALGSILSSFEDPVTAETAGREIRRLSPEMPADIVEELYRKRFLVDAGLGAERLLAEYLRESTGATLVPKITKVTFLVSEECNLACLGCYHSFHSFKNKRMTGALAAEILDGLYPFLRSRGIRRLHIAFLGYEPSLNFATIKAIYERAARLGADHAIETRFKIYTNAFHLEEEVYGWIAQRRADLGIKVSLDGIRADNDRRRFDFSGAGSHDQVVANLRRLIAGGNECSVLTVLSRLNLANIERFVDEMAALGLRRLTANLFCGQSAEERRLELDDAEKIDAIRRMDQATERYGMVFDGEWKYAVIQMVQGAQFSCPAGMRQLVFSADGEIYPCQRFAGTSVNFGNYRGDFWESLLERRCRTYDRWHEELHPTLEEVEAEDLDLSGWSCPFLSFQRGAGLHLNLEKDFNRMLLEYYVTRPWSRIIAR